MCARATVINDDFANHEKLDVQGLKNQYARDGNQVKVFNSDFNRQNYQKEGFRRNYYMADTIQDQSGTNYKFEGAVVSQKDGVIGAQYRDQQGNPLSFDARKNNPDNKNLRDNYLCDVNSRELEPPSYAHTQDNDRGMSR